MVAWPLSPERARTEWASRSDQRPSGLRLEQGQGLGCGIRPGDRRDHGRAVSPEDLAEVGVGGVLVEDRQGHRARAGRGLRPPGCWRVASAKSSKDHVGGVGASLEQSPLTSVAKLDDQPEGIGAAADLVDQPGGGDMPEVPRHNLGLMGLEEVVHIRGIDPEEDQGLVERQRPTKGVEDRAIELDQGETIEPLDPKRVEGESRRGRRGSGSPIGGPPLPAPG